jgi:hypothetical protein
MQSCISIISALGSVRQEDLEFEDSLGCTVSSMPAWKCLVRPYLKKRTEKKQSERELIIDLKVTHKTINILGRNLRRKIFRLDRTRNPEKEKLDPIKIKNFILQ